MGRTWDEMVQITKGFYFFQLVRKGDFSSSFWYSYPDHPPLKDYIYRLTSGLDYKGFDFNRKSMILGQKGTPVYRYDLTYSRLMSVLASSLTVVLVALFGWNYISSFVGVSAGMIFAMLPFFLGLSQLVTIESLLVFFFTASVYSFISFLRSISLRKALIAGIFLGLALGIKFTNVLLIPLFIWIYLLRYFDQDNKNKVKLFDKNIIYILISAFVTFFMLWPMPWLHLKEVLEFNYNARFLGSKTSVPEVFFGRLMLTPTVYYIVHFLITTPLIILGFFLVGLKNISNRKKWIMYSLIAWFLLPFVQSLYNFRQHGIRYIIEIYAPLSLIAALGFDSLNSKFTKSLKIKILYFIPVSIYLFAVLLRISPYYLDYFNALVGGAKNVYEKRLFQLGWWGQGAREVGIYLAKNAPYGSTVGLAIVPIDVMPFLEGLKVSRYESTKAYDYAAVSYFNIVRQGFDDSEIRAHYKSVYIVNADGAALITVYKHAKR